MAGELQPHSQNFAYKRKVQCVMQGKICTFSLSLLGSIMLYDINELIYGKDKRIGVIYIFNKALMVSAYRYYSQYSKIRIRINKLWVQV